MSNDDAHGEVGLHGIDFGGGFLAVFCERENLLAMYPHVCPEQANEATAAKMAALADSDGFCDGRDCHHGRLAAENTEAS